MKNLLALLALGLFAAAAPVAHAQNVAPSFTLGGAAGETWTARASDRNWFAVASSSDGSKLVAVVEGGQLYTSTDSGGTWTARDSARNWFAVTSSADGSKLVAVERGGQIYTSVSQLALTVPASSGLVTSNLFVTAISAGPSGEAAQTVSFTVTTDNNALFSVPPAIDASGTLTFTPSPTASGTATVTVSARDTGGTAGGGVDTSAAQTFTVTVTPVNTAPTLAAIAAPAAILKGAGAQTVSLTGITAGGGESQGLAVTATSGNPGLIPHPTVTYTSPAATGSLSYTPVANASGTAVITVTVRDGGGTANGGVDVTTRTFTVTVTPVNTAPTLAAIAAPAAILKGAGAQTVSLTGITAGGGESQGLTVTAISGNPGLIPHPAVTYSSPAATGSLSYTPVANASGTAVITVTVRDTGGTANGGVDVTTRTFTVTVRLVVRLVNTASVAGADTLLRLETSRSAQVLRSTLLANDTDADRDPLTVTGGLTLDVGEPPPGATGTRVRGADVVITFIGVPGHSYRVQHTTRLTAPYDWQEFSPAAVFTAPDGGVFDHTDVAPGGSGRFYRAIPNP